MLPPGGAEPWNVTLWRASENCHVTEPPVGIVTLGGANVALGVVTVIDGAAGGGGGGVLGGGAGGDWEAASCTTIVPRMPLSR